ncbi:MAG: NADH-quinone oxidoreductase subunit C [Bacteroidota bacterium]|nr:NADH-quinone oxidoreductase subunit C [Bacteroidota bacterium]MDP4233071.1 NADH-quinone oxidoreductase subunit C [Bacteroidota bacterium]MDP4241784.1 NADH-quinone oxidoreductase subunit C [Bacteroidota bacterium]MDP4288795.1 NADH-quinone oxidoreductase subunit C [Bacteroidota bacterium]
MFSFEQLKETDASLNFVHVDIAGDEGAIVSRERILDVAKRLKHEFGFLHLMDAFGHDRMEKKERFEVSYNIRNPKTKQRIFLKVRCEERDPHVPSLCSVWEGCNWNERETYDMFGVIFDNHPDLRRMYMPEDFEYHPLRKDFPLMGIPGSIPLPHHEDADPRFDVANRGE